MRVICIFVAILILCSCEKKVIKSERGGIDIITNVYFNASKSLDSVKTVLVSKINYKNDTIVELVPNFDFPEIIDNIFIIKDSLAFEIDEEDSQQMLFSNLKNGISVLNKKRGAVFSKEHLPNFYNRHDLNDTILFKKKYKRFFINSPQSYTTFYIFETDTLLPYAFYPKESKKYKGRIERIDSYNKEKDMFISLQLILRSKWDDEAKNIFDFNDFAQNQKRK